MFQFGLKRHAVIYCFREKTAPSSPGGENREGTKKGPMTFVNFTQFKENLAYIRASRTFYFPNNLAQIRATIVAHIAEIKLKSVIPIWHYRKNVDFSF